MTAQVQQPGDARPAAARAGGSSFYLAMRILGREKREAMFEIYSFCRAVDDIADGDVPGDKLALLAAWRENIDALYAGRVPPGLEGLAKAISHYGLRKDDFQDPHELAKLAATAGLSNAEFSKEFEYLVANDPPAALWRDGSEFK